MISILDGNRKNIKESNYVHSSWSDTCKMSMLQSKACTLEKWATAALWLHIIPHYIKTEPQTYFYINSDWNGLASM